MSNERIVSENSDRVIIVQDVDVPLIVIKDTDTTTETEIVEGGKINWYAYA